MDSSSGPVFPTMDADNGGGGDGGNTEEVPGLISPVRQLSRRMGSRTISDELIMSETSSESDFDSRCGLSEQEQASLNAIRSRLINEELPYTLSKIVKLLEQLMLEIDPAQAPSSGGSTPPLPPTLGINTKAPPLSPATPSLVPANSETSSHGNIKRGRRDLERHHLLSSASSTASGPAALPSSRQLLRSPTPESNKAFNSNQSIASGVSATSSRAARLPSPLHILRNRPASRASVAKNKEASTPATMVEPPSAPPLGSAPATGDELIAQLQMQQAQLMARKACEGGLHMAHRHSKNSTSSTQNHSGMSPTSISSGLRNLTRKGLHIGHGEATSSAAPSVSYSTSSSTWMDVSLLLDGYYIRYADIDLRLHKASRSLVSRRPGFVSSGSHHQFRTQLHQPNHPWMLDQVYEVHHQVHSQVLKLNEFLESLQDNQAVGEDDVLYASAPSEQQTLDAQHCLHDLVVALTEARNVMTNPSPRTFPQVLRPSDPRGGCEFTPAPPSEIVIDFAVHLGDLIVTAYELNYFAQGQNKETSVMTDMWVQTCDYTNKVFRFSDPPRTVQVVDQVQVHFKVHSLKWVMESIYEAYNLAIRMLRKLEALNKHDMTLKFNGGPEEEAEARRIQDEMKKFGSVPVLKYSNWITG